MILITLERTGIDTIARCTTGDGVQHSRRARNGAAAVSDLIERLTRGYSGEKWLVFDHPELHGTVPLRVVKRKRA